VRSDAGRRERSAGTARQSSARKFRLRNRTKWCSSGWINDTSCAEESWIKSWFLSPGPVDAAWRNAQFPFLELIINFARREFYVYIRYWSLIYGRRRNVDRDIIVTKISITDKTSILSGASKEEWRITLQLFSHPEDKSDKTKSRWSFPIMRVGASIGE